MPVTENYDQALQAEEQAYRQRRHKDQSRRWGSILLLIGIVWLVFALTQQVFLGANSFGAVEQTQPIEATFTATGLVVDLVGGDVRLVRGAGPAIQIEATKHAFGWNTAAAEQALQDLDLTIDQRGDTVHVTGPRATGLGMGRTPYVSLRISLPSNTRFDVENIDGDLVVEAVIGDGEVVTTNGDISIENTQGSLTLKTTNGTIELDQHRGALVIETINGDITIEDSDLRQLQVNSVDGDISLEGVTGLLNVLTVAGDIEVKAARAARLDLESTSGDVEFAGSLAPEGPQRVMSIAGDVNLRLPAASNLQLVASTLSGDLEADVTLHEAERERRQVRGVLGAGGPLLQVTSTSGDVAIEID